MAYLVRVLPRAERDLEAIFLYIQGLTSPPARKWFNGLVTSIDTLTEHPQRHPATPESRKLRYPLYRNRLHIYRVIYSIDKPGCEVNIIHVRHHAQSAFLLETID